MPGWLEAQSTKLSLENPVNSVKESQFSCYIYRNIGITAWPAGFLLLQSQNLLLSNKFRTIMNLAGYVDCAVITTFDYAGEKKTKLKSNISGYRSSINLTWECKFLSSAPDLTNKKLGVGQKALPYNPASRRFWCTLRMRTTESVNRRQKDEFKASWVQVSINFLPCIRTEKTHIMYLVSQVSTTQLANTQQYAFVE